MRIRLRKSIPIDSFSKRHRARQGQSGIQERHPVPESPDRTRSSREEGQNRSCMRRVENPPQRKQRSPARRPGFFFWTSSWRSKRAVGGARRAGWQSKRAVGGARRAVGGASEQLAEQDE